MTRIKICGITRMEDALIAARCGADAIGLVFYPGSPRFIRPDTAAPIVRALPPFVTTVGLFVNAAKDEVEAVLRSLPIGLLQFHGEEPPAFCEQFGVPYLKALRVRTDTDLLQYAAEYAGAKALLLDAYHADAYGGTGRSFDWGLIPRDLPLPIVLSGGLCAANVGAAIRAVRPWAVDVSSGVEAAKGIKDPDKIAEFVKGVRDADV